MKVIYFILSFISYHLAHLQLQMDKLIYHAIDQPFVHKRYWIIHHQSGLKKRIHFHTHDLSLPYNYNDDLLLCTNVCSSRVNLFIYGRSNKVNLSKCKNYLILSFIISQISNAYLLISFIHHFQKSNIKNSNNSKFIYNTMCMKLI